MSGHLRWIYCSLDDDGLESDLNPLRQSFKVHRCAADLPADAGVGTLRNQMEIRTSRRFNATTVRVFTVRLYLHELNAANSSAVSHQPHDVAMLVSPNLSIKLAAIVLLLLLPLGCNSIFAQANFLCTEHGLSIAGASVNCKVAVNAERKRRRRGGWHPQTDEC